MSAVNLQKRAAVTMCICVLTGILNSCSKDREMAIYTFNEEVAGKYVFNIAYLLSGDLIDLEGDRRDYGNIVSMFGYPNVDFLADTFGGYVTPITAGRDRGRIYLKFPLQNVVIEEDGSYSIGGNPLIAGITFSNAVNMDGSVDVLPEVDYTEVTCLMKMNEHRYISVDNAEIMQLSEGRISMEVNIGYYDYISQSLVNCRVMVVYYKA